MENTYLQKIRLRNLQICLHLCVCVHARTRLGLVMLVTFSHGPDGQLFPSLDVLSSLGNTGEGILNNKELSPHCVKSSLPNTDHNHIMHTFFLAQSMNSYFVNAPRQALQTLEEASQGSWGIVCVCGGGQKGIL